ncbi:Crp/Fnr family transcriptional regulator [bacterium 210820-DFI.6.52]|uniref:cAMP-binding domain of CRP or a regulatory subunit of cAMP-dependent protein kinases n=1 Tax=Bittarella massiliensis (ex Durand et al. 2017) TaxID=1720313 RepID=A0AAQ1RVY3_9FIRM|nr:MULTISPECIES: Crp/Fnr family transcriptional regulator [Eubacteriales]MCB5940655.1 Crp/Fnr family transcriptional regulator [bacterium 210820-DFI.6.52]MZL69101.1 hypothetical protein [Bittarella massiliensis (ex Durand et al. 2017)]MZL79893.1 hypothetical protein [Bittarella massiliensis (ex Durand et al. 2017)]SHG12129.1 cAMP-binding domain of CRP or a regulatory subunit of cAMP-dependent protein kinases [Bittarella massiliensis (ex Durand et al. 2017)]
MTHLLEQWPQAAPFFEGLPQEEQEKIELCQIGPGELLIEKDSFAPPDLFFLVRGVCEHFRAFAESGDNDLTGIRLFAGQFIGVAEILSPQPMKRRNQVRAKTQVSALRIHGQDFLRWSQICLPVYNAILLYIIEQKHDDQRLYRECNVNNSLLAGARYLSFLYSIYRDCCEPDEKGAIRILETRSEIGRYIGRDPRSVDRIIQKLREQGYVGGSHRKITVTEEQHRRLLDLVEELTL